MSIYKGTTLLAGGPTTIPLFTPLWQDHIVNDISWLRSDTFSWQSGDVYTSAYQHLVDDLGEKETIVTYYSWYYGDSDVYTLSETPSAGDNYYTYIGEAATGTIDSVGSNTITINGTTWQRDSQDTPVGEITYDATQKTETIAGTTITYYQATDGHKIVLAEQESKVISIYAETGVAWYYILDTENTRFKLPRTQWNFVGYRNGPGKFVDESLPNITGYIDLTDRAPYNGLTEVPSNSAIYQDSSKTRLTYASNDLSKQVPYSINFDASRSSGTYQNGAPVQPRATQMYLYFYIGQFTQTAIQQTAGITAETLNGKADRADITDLCMPNYAQCIAGGLISPGTWIQVPKDSQVVCWGTDPYTENYNTHVSPDSGQTLYQVGYRYDDTNSNTEGTSFCFLVPKNWYFTCNIEQGFHYRIYPLKGAN